MVGDSVFQLAKTFFETGVLFKGSMICLLS